MRTPRTPSARPDILHSIDDGTSRRLLRNGALVVVRTLSTATAAIVVEFRWGSGMDPDGLEGLHHFLEHMAFQGAGGRDFRGMAEAFDDIAADVNASTSQTSLRLEVSVMPRHVDEALALLADMVLRPTLDEARIENERAIILQEISDQDDDAEVDDAVAAVAYAGDPVSRPVAGTARSVKAIRRGHLVEQHAAAFVGRRCTIAVAGPVDRQATIGAISDLFSDMPAGSVPPHVSPVEHRPGKRTLRGVMGQTMLRMTWPAPTLGMPDESAAIAAVHILGSGPTSRLMRRLREADGLCYSVWAHAEITPTHGITTVGFDTEARSGRRAVRAVLEEIARLATDVEERDLVRAKRFLEMDMLRIVDRPLSMATLVAGRARDDCDDTSRLIRQMEDVTLDEVKAHLRTMTPERCAAASMGGGGSMLADLPV